MTNEVAQLVAAELARLAAQNPPTDWLKIVTNIGSIVTPLVLAIIGYYTVKLNAKQATADLESRKSFVELQKSVDGQTDKLLKATSEGQRALGKEEGVKEASAAAATTAAAVATTKSEIQP